MIPPHIREKILRKFNRWRYEEPEKLGKELAEEHLEYLREILSIEEACDKMDTQYHFIKQKIQDAFDIGDVNDL